MTKPLLDAGIRTRGLRKSFGPVRAVDGLDLDIVAGETVALLGPNGAGKSTTIDILLGLARPDAGEITVFGRQPADATRSGLVSAMLQSGGLIGHVTVRELISMTGSLYRRPMPVDEVLGRAGITGIGQRRTNGLSGGQTQRVRFALALVADPELLVLDEPTVGMDVESRRAFWAAMRDFAASGRTVLFATHYLEEADEFADRVVLMARGRIVADGPATAIKAIVGGRTIRCTLPGADPDRLALLPGVTAVELRGDGLVLRAADSDAALRALLAAEPAARDIEVSGAALEDAFIALTTDAPDHPGSVPGSAHNGSVHNGSVHTGSVHTGQTTPTDQTVARGQELAR
ncbi:MAG: type transport system ATP-binding protein [Mycobacteriales bacterium]|jgi:ABC-2 type transport system ATP-binding protein